MVFSSWCKLGKIILFSHCLARKGPGKWDPFFTSFNTNQPWPPTSIWMLMFLRWTFWGDGAVAHVRHVVCSGNYPGQPKPRDAGCQKPQEAKERPRGRHGHWSLSPSWGRCHRLQLLGLLVWEVWSVRQLSFPPLAFSLFLGCMCRERGAGTVPSNRLNISHLFSCRRVTSITTRAVRCSKCTQMFTEGEEMYLQGKVVWRVQ